MMDARAMVLLNSTDHMRAKVDLKPKIGVRAKRCLKPTDTVRARKLLKSKLYMRAKLKLKPIIGMRAIPLVKPRLAVRANRSLKPMGVKRGADVAVSCSRDLNPRASTPTGTRRAERRGGSAAVDKKMKCKHCGSKNVVKAGFDYAGRKKQRWLCKDCGRFTLASIGKVKGAKR